MRGGLSEERGWDMLDDLLERRPYNAATDLVDAPVARGLGDKLAFIDSDRALTYRGLQARSCRFASALADLGLRPEERLALLLYDTVDFPVAFWGGVRAGIVVLPLNTLLTPEQYAYILGDSRAAGIVVSASSAKVLAPVLDRLPRLRTMIVLGGNAEDRVGFSGRFARAATYMTSPMWWRAAAPSLSPHRRFPMRWRSGCTRRVRPASRKASNTCMPRCSRPRV